MKDSLICNYCLVLPEATCTCRLAKIYTKSGASTTIDHLEQYQEQLEFNEDT